MLKEEKNLKLVKDFINHNLNIGYITKDITVEQLLSYIDNIENQYIPMLKYGK